MRSAFSGRLFTVVIPSVVAALTSLLFLLASVPSARATVLIEGQQGAIFNFDFTSTTFPILSTTVTIPVTNVSSYPAEIAWRYYDGLNASGASNPDSTYFFSAAPSTGYPITISQDVRYSIVTDGRWSLRVFNAVVLHSNYPTITIGVPSATSFSNSDFSGLSATATGTPVPEPSTVMLFTSGLGLLGLFGLREKRKKLGAIAVA